MSLHSGLTRKRKGSVGDEEDVGRTMCVHAGVCVQGCVGGCGRVYTEGDGEWKDGLLGWAADC